MDQHHISSIAGTVSIQIREVDHPNIISGRLHQSSKAAIPTSIGISGAENHLTPAIEYLHVKSFDELRILHAKHIIQSIVIWCKRVRHIQRTDPFDDTNAVRYGAASIGGSNGISTGLLNKICSSSGSVLP